MRTSSVFTTRASASTRCGGGGGVGKASRRHAHRSINRTRRAAAASVCRASGRDVDAPRSTHTMVVYWDLDNIRPPSGCEALWLARIEAAAKRFVPNGRVETRVYANENTLGKDERRACFRRSGVTLVEVSNAPEAADEAILSDAYVLARDAVDAGQTNDYSIMVCTCDERLSDALARARARGLFTVALSDYMRGKRNRAEFRTLFSACSSIHSQGMSATYVYALQTIASTSKMFRHSKLANAAHEAVLWDPRRVFKVTPEELNVHNAVFERDPDAFGAPVACPGNVVGALRDGDLEPWLYESASSDVNPR